MAYPLAIKEAVRAARQHEKLTLTEIVERFGVSKSTAYLWTKDLPLKEVMDHQRSQKFAVVRLAGSAAMQQKYRTLREEAYQEAWQQAPTLFAIPTFSDFITLYLAEGSKRQRSRVSICNTDPDIMQFAFEWFQRLEVDLSRMRCCIRYYPDHNIEDLTEFWMAVFKNPDLHVTAEPKPPGKTVPARRAEHGICSLSIASTSMHMQFQAWMDYLKTSWRSPVPV